MNNDNSLANNNIIIDSVHCTISKDGRSDKIDPIITRLLVYFAQHPDIVISRNELAEKVWKSGFTSDDAINRSISTLRRALSENRGEFIKTIPKKGYCFSAPEWVELTILAEEQAPDESKVDDLNDKSVPVNSSPVNSSERLNTNYSLALEPNLQTQAKAIIEEPTYISTEKNTTNPDGALSPTKRFKRPLRNILVFSVLLVSLLLLFRWWGNHDAQPLSGTKLNNHYDNHAVISDKLLLTTGLWREHKHDGKLNGDFIGQIQNMLLLQLSREDRFVIDYQQGLNKPIGYRLDGVVETFGENVVVNLTLVDHKTNTVRQRFSISTVLKDSIETIDVLSKEMAAAVRLVLLNKKWFERYRGALDTFTYADLEHLIHARLYLNNNVLSSLDFSSDLLDKLEKKYPNNAYPLGVKALRYTYFMVNGHNLHTSTYENIQKALQLDPTNLDALIALFHNYNLYSGTRSQAKNVVDVMLRYHPFEQEAWRTKLFYLIKNASSCEQISHFIDEIPAGIFAPRRLSVIERIMAVCLEGANVNQLMMAQPQSYSEHKKEWRTLVNNLYLFEIHHDHLEDVFQQKHYFRPKYRYLIERYATVLQMDDQLQAQSLAQKIADSIKGYDLWFASLYANVYQQAGFGINAFDYEGDMRFIDRYANLYFAVVLAKQARITSDRSGLQRYLDQRLLLDLSMISRNDALARIIALRANGQLEESQQLAARLFSMIETYRLAHKKSYHFYNLGRIQLISAFYCGDHCIDLNSEDSNTLLAQWFTEQHIWWIDDAKFVELALSDWSTHALVQTYLERIETDKLALKQLKGF